MRIAPLPLLAQACGLVLVAAVASQTGIAPAAGARSAQTAATVTPAPISASVRIATYNTAAAVTVSDSLADIKNLAADGADVITLQEMGGGARRAAVTAALVDCSMCEYEAYMPADAPMNSTPILYKWSRFRLESTGTRQVSEATYVGPRGAGPSTLRAKYINYVELRERATGQEVFILNNHTVPSVQAQDGGSDPTMPARLELYKQHMTGLKALITEIKATGAAVVVTGDLNVNFRRDRIVKDRLFPYVNMGQVGVHASYESLGEPVRGTHVLPNGNDARLIDYVSFLTHPAVVPTAQRVLLGYHSDHRPLVVDFKVSMAS
jgi:endonuclease/exonuclease/phosphatase (EEP) superfamily protein YafD